MVASAPPKAAAPEFFPGLESLRGIAALLVALYHVSWQSHVLGWAFVQHSFLMVDFFFVLSGFVICHAYGQRLQNFASAKTFVFLRLARLYPLHLATLLAWVAIEWTKVAVVHFHWATLPYPPFVLNTLPAFISNLFLAHGMGFHAGPTWNIPSWSVSTEFYTYLVFAVVCLVSSSSVWRMMASGVLAGIGFAVSWTYVGSLNSIARLAFFRCIFSFFCGVIAWHVFSQLRRLPIGASLLTAVELVAGGASIWMVWKRPSDHTDFLLVPAFSVLILAVALGKGTTARLLELPPLVWLGTVSYSIYMVHPLVAWCFEFLLQYVWRVPRNYVTYIVPTGRGDAMAVAYAGLVLLVSQLTFSLIEQPFRRRAKRYLSPRELRESLPQPAPK